MDSIERPWALPEVSTTTPIRRATTADADPGDSTAQRFDSLEEVDRPTPRPFRMQPLTIPEILDGAFGILRASPLKVVSLAATFSAPIDLFLAFINKDALAGGGVFDDFGVLLESDAAQDGNIFGSQFALGFVLPQFALIFTAAALAKLVSDWLQGHDPSYGEVMKFVGRRSWKIVAVWSLVHLAELIGLVLLIVPALFVMVMFLMSIPALITEDLGIIEALKRSRTLAKGIGARVFGVAVASAFIMGSIGIALNVLPLLLGSWIGETYGWLVVALGSLFTSILSLVGAAGITLILYYDTRVRREGLDLELDARSAFAAQSTAAQQATP